MKKDEYEKIYPLNPLKGEGYAPKTFPKFCLGVKNNLLKISNQ